MILTTSILLAACLVFNLFSASVYAEPTDAVHPDHDSTSCKCLIERKEWRALTDEEKKCYINAVKCLQTLPARNTSRPESWTRFDEFQATHVELAAKVHFVGHFLPWHRHLLKSYENALRNECDYKGAQPYWDWSIDADPPNLISKSPIWDAITGFGGDGVVGTYTVPPDPANTSKIFPDYYHGCIKDGPFADYTVKLGPGLLGTEHCITRGVNDTNSVYLNSSVIEYILAIPTFEQFRIKLEGLPTGPPDMGPHGGGHFAVGGDMTNYYSSPGDPLFYMHHTSVDRIWWLWEEASHKRIYEVDGITSVMPPYGHLTLDFLLEMGSVGPTIPVRDVMDIRKEPSCYTYV